MKVLRSPPKKHQQRSDEVGPIRERKQAVKSVLSCDVLLRVILAQSYKGALKECRSPLRVVLTGVRKKE